MIRRWIATLVVAAFFLLPVTVGTAQENPETPAASGLPAEARQFDFWLGDWEANFSGTIAPNAISSFGLGGGIAILEFFSFGYGTSVSVYDARGGQWRQTWYDADGLLIEVAGTFENGKMVLVGQELRVPTGAVLGGRLTWSNISNQRFDFLYEVSTNGGATWQNSVSARFNRANRRGAGTRGPSRLPQAPPLPRQFRQFNFLEGTWVALTPVCESPGVSEVSFFGQRGIALLEDLTCGDDYRATSVCVYDSRTELWRWTSIDSMGLYLELDGGPSGDDMVLEGDFDDPETGTQRRGRLTFHPVSGSEIERTFEVSDDSGSTWTVATTLRYVTEALSQPADLQATKIKKKKVALSWKDLSAAETRYEVLRRDGEEWTVIASLPAGSTEVTIKKLRKRTTYTFGIRPCDAAECADPAEIVVTTK